MPIWRLVTQVPWKQVLHYAPQILERTEQLEVFRGNQNRAVLSVALENHALPLEMNPAHGFAQGVPGRGQGKSSHGVPFCTNCLFRTLSAIPRFPSRGSFQLRDRS